MFSVRWRIYECSTADVASYGILSKNRLDHFIIYCVCANKYLYSPLYENIYKK